MIYRLKIIFLFIYFIFSITSGARPQIKIHGNLYVQGTQVQLSNQKTIYAFYGIPFANRKEAAVVPRPIEYDSYNYSSDDRLNLSKGLCLNPDENQYVAPEQGGTSLNDLIDFNPNMSKAIPDASKSTQLDVYLSMDHLNTHAVDDQSTDNYKNKALKRVVLYIHGGMLESNNRRSLDYAPHELLRLEGFAEKIVLVGVEYSLGWYGFRHVDFQHKIKELSREELEDHFYEKPASNIAIHELIQAIKWIQNNIKAFGGDAEKVTVMGHSSGAALAQYLHLALFETVRIAYGLNPNPIKHLLLMGGSAALFDAISLDNAGKKGKALMNFANALLAQNHSPFPSLTDESKLAYLPPSFVRNVSVTAKIIWSPVIDGILVTGTVDEMLAMGKFDTTVKIMFVVADAEASPLSEAHEALLEKKGFGIFDQELDSLAFGKGIKKVYPNHKDNVFKTLAQLSTDILFINPAQHSIEKYKSSGVFVSQHLLLYQLKDDLPLILERKYAEYLEKNMSGFGSIMIKFAAKGISIWQWLVSFVLRRQTSIDLDQSIFVQTLKDKLGGSFQKVFENVKLLPLFNGDERKHLFDFIQFKFNQVGSFHSLDQALLLNWKISKSGVNLYMADLVDLKMFNRVFDPVFFFC